jgi:hypothetical protein
MLAKCFFSSISTQILEDLKKTPILPKTTWSLILKAPFELKWIFELLVTLLVLSKIAVIFWNFIEIKELNELLGKIIFHK